MGPVPQDAAWDPWYLQGSYRAGPPRALHPLSSYWFKPGTSSISTTTPSKGGFPLTRSGEASRSPSTPHSSSFHRPDTKACGPPFSPGVAPRLMSSGFRKWRLRWQPQAPTSSGRVSWCLGPSRPGATLPDVWAGSNGESCRYNRLAYAQNRYQGTEQGEEGSRKLPGLP